MLTDESARAFVSGLSLAEFWVLIDAVATEVQTRGLISDNHHRMAFVLEALRGELRRRLEARRAVHL